MIVFSVFLPVSLFLASTTGNLTYLRRIRQEHTKLKRHLCVGQVCFSPVKFKKKTYDDAPLPNPWGLLYAMLCTWIFKALSVARFKRKTKEKKKVCFLLRHVPVIDYFLCPDAVITDNTLLPPSCCFLAFVRIFMASAVFLFFNHKCWQHNILSSLLLWSVETF